MSDTVPVYQRAWQDNPEPPDWDEETGDDQDWTEAQPEAIPFPQPDDHDRRFDDMYSNREGDIGDEGLYPF